MTLYSTIVYHTLFHFFLYHAFPPWSNANPLYRHPKELFHKNDVLLAILRKFVICLCRRDRCLPPRQCNIDDLDFGEELQIRCT